MIGTWGLVGQNDNEIDIHYCVDGATLISHHPELSGKIQYLRKGGLWEIETHGHGKYRMIRLQLPHWNPANPRTCPKCRKAFDALMIEQQGKAQEEETAKV